MWILSYHQLLELGRRDFVSIKESYIEDSDDLNLSENLFFKIQVSKDKITVEQP